MRLKVIVKECGRGGMTKMDVFHGSPETIAATLIQKYGGNTMLSMPAHEWLKMEVGPGERHA